SRGPRAHRSRGDLDRRGRRRGDPGARPRGRPAGGRRVRQGPRLRRGARADRRAPHGGSPVRAGDRRSRSGAAVRRTARVGRSHAVARRPGLGALPPAGPDARRRGGRGVRQGRDAAWPRVSRGASDRAAGPARRPGALHVPARDAGRRVRVLVLRAQDRRAARGPGERRSGAGPATPGPGVPGRGARRARHQAGARRARHRLPNGGAGRRRGVQPRPRRARRRAALRTGARRGREPTAECRQRRDDRARWLVPPRPGRAQRLDPRRPRRSAAAGTRAGSPGPRLALSLLAPMTIYPFTLHLGPLPITGYGLMMMVSFFMAMWSIQVDLKSRGMNEDYAADIIFAAVIGGIIGAKLWYVLFSGEWDSLFRRGGFVWYGGFLGGVVAVLLNGWRKGVPARWTCELTATAVPLGHALGRGGGATPATARDGCSGCTWCSAARSGFWWNSCAPRTTGCSARSRSPSSQAWGSSSWECICCGGGASP